MSYGYASYLIHMIERVTARTFFYEKEHHPLRIKNDLRVLVEDTRAAVPHSSPPMTARRRGQKRDKPLPLIQKIFSLLFEMCKSQYVADVKAQHERRAKRKDTKSVKEIHDHLNLQPPRSPIASEGEESPDIESFEE
jgi:AraC-like DNA-binding protein